MRGSTGERTVTSPAFATSDVSAMRNREAAKRRLAQRGEQLPLAGASLRAHDELSHVHSTRFRAVCACRSVCCAEAPQRLHNVICRTSRPAGALMWHLQVVTNANALRTGR